jgi:hypothetical protein
MVKAALAALVLAAPSAFASGPVALPNFDAAILETHAAIKSFRAGQVKAKSADVSGRLNSIAWDLERSEREASRLRGELRWLLQRARGYRREQGKPDPDPSLRWDLQRFNRDLQSVARDADWRLNDLRMLNAQVEKDPNAVYPAQRLVDAARRLKQETHWVAFDARFGRFDLMRAGFSMEGWDLDRYSSDLDARAQDLESVAAQILAKVRG